MNEAEGESDTELLCGRAQALRSRTEKKQIFAVGCRASLVHIKRQIKGDV